MNAIRSLGVALAFVAALWLAPSAGAMRPFTPELQISASTNRAAAHPRLTITVSKTRDGFHDDLSFYDEQDLRSTRITLPPGLTINPRGQQDCGMRRTDGRDYCANPEAKIGDAELDAAVWLKLFKESDPPLQIPPEIADLFPSPTDVAIPVCLPTLSASIYNEASESGELARTVMIVGETDISQVTLCGFDRFPITIPSIHVPGFSVASTATLDPASMAPVIVANDIPNSTTWGDAQIPLSVSRIEMTLDGNKGSDRGLPLVSNPTSCNEHSAHAQFQSYGDDDVPSSDDQAAGDVAGFAVEGCESLNYEPRLGLSLVPTTPLARPSLVQTLEQSPDGASTGELVFSMPPGFRLNPDRSIEICSNEQIAARACPVASQLGTVSMQTRLLAAPISGATYIGPAAGDRVRTVTFLDRPIQATIEGTMWQRPDGGIDSVSAGLPDIQLERLEYRAAGGDQAGFVNPATCGLRLAASTATSLDGRVATANHPIDVEGCVRSAGVPPRRLHAEIAPSRVNRPGRLRLLLEQDPAVKLRSLRMRLAGGLRWRLGDHSRRRALGALEITPEQGALVEYDLFARSSRSSSHRRLLLTPKTKHRSIRVLVSKRRAGNTTTLDVRGLPKRSIHDIDLRLFGTRDRLLRTPRRCHQRAPVAATIVDADATETRTSLTTRWSPGCPPSVDSPIGAP